MTWDKPFNQEETPMKDDRKPSPTSNGLALLVMSLGLIALASAPAVVIAIWRWALG